MGSSVGTVDLNVGDRVRIVPTDDDDVMAVEWNGRVCTVAVHVHGSVFQYVKVRDENGHRATFREKDCVKI